MTGGEEEQHLLIVYHMPGVVLRALSRVSHLFLTMALWVRSIIFILQTKKTGLSELTTLTNHTYNKW